MLGAGAVGLAAPLTTVSNASATAGAAADSGTLEIVPLTTTSYVFDAAYTSAFPFAELMGVTISGDLSLLNGSTLEVDYDPRVMSPTSADSVAASGIRTTHELAVVGGDGRDGDTATLSMALPALDRSSDMEQRAITVGVPLKRTADYPNDAVADPRPTRVRVRTDAASTGAELTVVPDHPDAVSGSAWGGSIAVVWDDLLVGDRDGSDRYSYPAYIRLNSVGPGDVPTGTQVSIAVDASICVLEITDVFAGDDPLQTVRTTQATTSDSGATTIVLTLQQALATGATLSIALSAHPTPITDDPRDISMARVSLCGPIHSDPLQRVTGAESASAVSESGRPRVAAAFTSKI